MDDPHEPRVGHSDGERSDSFEESRGSTDGPFRGVLFALVIYGAAAGLLYIGYLLFR